MRFVNDKEFKYSHFKRFFLDRVFLGEARQNISCSISFSLTIIDLKVILREFLGLTDLTKAQTFYIYKLTEIVMVNEDKDLIFAVFQEVTPSLKSLNNG